ncbi:MAG: IS630 transposase-related protein [Trichodesmium sp. St16_bin4-tuft]|nr:IS630 transposase-related protein [Trichodesmium sp. MAG_R01]MDE5074367.1 IS630 transposase-related protein [Trichodesmium sp. St5_bin8]MDE5077895.1 IS630 transposase-related protein [Trichodesmium sp. St2_bin6]MDE5092420.1 IS630 transposase-related protein [Trichodesmium sp. St18_bin3_1_1]MDE5099392.1 IS630 transposase-related protein [Trichodesmium sp. St16_bin4-tuft]MDE5101672.1 IS630 transposase-related protein [Trichodesmium sp. St19_bin2]
MLAPYSHDLRQKTIKAFNNGQSQSEVSRNFGISRNILGGWLKGRISRNILGGWLKGRKEIGDCKALTEFQKGCKLKIKDLEKF